MKYNVSEKSFHLISQERVLWKCLLFKTDNSPVFQAHNFTWEMTQDGDKNFCPEVITY